MIYGLKNNSENCNISGLTHIESSSNWTDHEAVCIILVPSVCFCEVKIKFCIEKTKPVLILIIKNMMIYSDCIIKTQITTPKVYIGSLPHLFEWNGMQRIMQGLSSAARSGLDLGDILGETFKTQR